MSIDPQYDLLYVEYVVAEQARDNAYDEMLDRRGKYIDLYGLDMEADERNGNDEMGDLLNAIDNTDVEFWQWHNNVNQRYSNAAAAFGQRMGMPEQELLRIFNARYGTMKEIAAAQIDWVRHATDGLYDQSWFSSTGEL